MAKLLSGYTTGTCAAIAAAAATRMIFIQKTVYKESILTPKGVLITADVVDPKFSGGSASCAVKKYSGDDPDITNGMLIYATVSTSCGTIEIDGGEGVGRVTKPGLNQPVGAAAINSTPRKMIAKSVRNIIDAYGADCGAKIIISIPGGEETAKKTFNPRLGIVGGLSVLGTSGIVEPMSTKAIIDTINVELNFRKSNGLNYVLTAPGNYGRDFIHNILGLDIDSAVKCSNYIGETINMAIDKNFCGIVLIGHVGKLIKLAAGIMNTHSKNADGRMEVLCTHSALCGADKNTVKKIFLAPTTDEAISIIKSQNILAPVMESICKMIEFHLSKRCIELPFAFLMFSNVHGELCRGGDKNIFNSAIKELEDYKKCLN